MEILHAAEFLAEYLCHNSHAQSFGQVVRVKVHFKKTDYKEFNPRPQADVNSIRK